MSSSQPTKSGLKAQTSGVPLMKPVLASASVDVNKCSMIAGQSRNAEASSVHKVIWHEMLTYIHYFRNSSNAEALRQTVLGFFNPGDIVEGKKLLVQELQCVDGVEQYATERRSSATRQAHEAELDDVLGLFDVADSKASLDGRIFVATDLGRLPKFGPEEINLGVVVDRQVKMEESIKNLSSSVQHLASTTPVISDQSVVDQSLPTLARDIDRRLAEFNDVISSRLDHLHAVCAQLTDSVNVRVKSPPHSHPSPPQRTQLLDRSMNLVVFGIAEDRSAPVWRQKVDEVLKFVTEHDVDCVDMFRIGRYNDTKTRPIIVKLRTAWDRRIILASCNKLKNYKDKVFISPDESIESRRKRTFDRMKVQAERRGDKVVCDNGVLIIEDKPAFSLKDGKIINHDG